jgi:hypothetical protein
MRVIDSANGAEEQTKVCSQPERTDLLGSLLEPCAGKLARTVLRGGWRSDAPSLPDIGSRSRGDLLLASFEDQLSV